MTDFNETIKWKDITTNKPPAGVALILCEKDYPCSFLGMWNPTISDFGRLDSPFIALRVNVSHWANTPEGPYSLLDKSNEEIAQ